MQSDVASAATADVEISDPAGPTGELPHRLRLLWIGGEEPSWAGLALRLDAAGCVEPRFRWASDPGEALAALRDENFDCVLVSDPPSPSSLHAGAGAARQGDAETSRRGDNERGRDNPASEMTTPPLPLSPSPPLPEAEGYVSGAPSPCPLPGGEGWVRGRFDAFGDTLSLLQAVRGSGYDDPMIFITSQIDDVLRARLCALDCDVLVTPDFYNSPALLPLIRRAMLHMERMRENHRLSIVHQRRLLRERDEAEHLLQQQRGIIAKLEGPLTQTSPSGKGLAEGLLPADLEAGRTSDSVASVHAGSPANGAQVELPDETKEFYHELLRTYVIMGSGSLAAEIGGFANLLVTAGVGPRQALRFHLERVEALVGNLGNRSARHVMARADLLALELMVHIGEEYRRREPAVSSADADAPRA